MVHVREEAVLEGDPGVTAQKLTRLTVTVPRVSVRGVTVPAAVRAPTLTGPVRGDCSDGR